MKDKKFLIPFFLGLVGFATVWIIMSSGNAVKFDYGIINFFRNHTVPGLTIIMQLFTYLGDWQGVAIVTLLLLMYSETRFKYGVPAVASIVVAQGIKTVVKEVVKRARPDESLRLIAESGYSFPSGHSITGMAMFGVIFVLAYRYMERGTKRNIVLVTTGIMPFIVGTSRVYLGVHFPTDVMAGWLAGITVVSFIVMLQGIIEERKIYE